MPSQFVVGCQNTQQNSTQNKQEYAAAYPDIPEKDFNWVI
jgi:hypothetical protein